MRHAASFGRILRLAQRRAGRTGKDALRLLRHSLDISFLTRMGVSRRIWRAWFVVAISWSAFWMWLYVISGPNSSQDRLDRTAATILMMALPWIGGWLIYWVVPGSGRIIRR